MRVNGYIYGEVIPGTGIDENGEPISVEPIFLDPIPANITLNTDSRKGVYEDGEFRQISATILIESDTSSACRYKRIRIVCNGEDMGVMRVLSATPLLSVGRLQLSV